MILKFVPEWLITVAFQILVTWPGIENERPQFVNVWEEVF